MTWKGKQVFSILFYKQVINDVNKYTLKLPWNESK